ncbi:MAG TPA: hypothetical protein HA341_04765 [Halobacteria archaeon]|nr:hypothetical protein [Halobacteria archaeon]
MNEDEKITKISDMLIKGGKMLSTHCSSCGSPLFKINNETVCPVCETRFIDEKDIKVDKERKKENLYDRSIIKDNEKKVSKTDLSKDDGTFNEDLRENIEKKVSTKILDIFGEIETEKDFTKIQMGLNCIKELIDIIKLLKNV